MTRVLIIEDDASIRELLASELVSSGYDVTEAKNGREGLLRARDESPEVVLLDLRLPDIGGEQVLDELVGSDDAPQIIVLTAHGSVASAVEAMKSGAFDFLEKPYRLAELEVVLEKAVQASALRRENLSLRRLLGSTAGSSYLSPTDSSSGAFDRLIQKVARAELPVLITGETGTGKEVTARLIHGRSERASGPFLVADCAALQPTLIESELFGHERGAFTGAHATRAGLVETARGGTLFLDEIGDLDLPLQSKLLRLLETGEYRRVGGSKPLLADARFIAATHRDLEAEMQNRRFREDLYFRLKVLTVHVPSLRDRRCDIVPLAEHFLKQRAGGALRFADKTLTLMERYPWPGNVRELRNVVERMAALTDGPVLEPDELPGEIRARGQPGPPGKESPRTLAEAERRHILAVLHNVGGNRARAAEALGISQATLYNKLKRYREEGE